MTLYEGAKTRVKVDSELSEEFEINVEMHQESVLLPFFFSICDGCCSSYMLSLDWQDRARLGVK